MATLWQTQQLEQTDAAHNATLWVEKFEGKEWQVEKSFNGRDSHREMASSVWSLLWQPVAALIHTCLACLPLITSSKSYEKDISLLTDRPIHPPLACYSLWRVRHQIDILVGFPQARLRLSIKQHQWIRSCVLLAKQSGGHSHTRDRKYHVEQPKLRMSCAWSPSRQKHILFPHFLLFTRATWHHSAQSDKYWLEIPPIYTNQTKTKRSVIKFLLVVCLPVSVPLFNRHSMQSQ